MRRTTTVRTSRFGASRAEETSTHHDIDDENSNVTKGRTTSSKIRERFVTRGIDDEETGKLVFCEISISENASLLLDSVHREVGGSDLLSDSSCFSFLNVRLTNLPALFNQSRVDSLPREKRFTHLVEEFGFTSIDVTHDYTNGRT